MKTVNLELSKSLKEVGYEQEPMAAYWYQSKLARGEWQYSINLFPGKQIDWDGYKEDQFFASPTADEILEKLPRQMEVKKSGVLEFPYWVKVGDDEMTGESLADAAAKMWLYLRKEGLL